MADTSSSSSSFSRRDSAHLRQQERDLSTDPKNIKEILDDLSERFQNFDDPKTYTALVDKALGRNTANFAVRFGVDHSEIAIGLSQRDMSALLQPSAARKDHTDVTWINIWSPTENRAIVKAIAKHYKFSARLGVTILGWDEARWQVVEKLKQPEAAHAGLLRTGDHNILRARRTHSRAADPEAPVPVPAEQRRALARQAGNEIPELHEEDLHMYKLLQEQYNYTTIDHGSNFVCIGANWLHERPKVSKDSPQTPEDAAKQNFGEMELVPPKHWAWYILTSDGTVISIHETPNFEIPRKRGVDLAAWQKQELQNMRKNTYDLLSQLSVPGMKRYQYRTMSQKGVRSDLSLRKQDSYSGTISARTTVAESPVVVDASSNLFFYLFEDYSAATKILSQSNVMLSQLTDEVLRITDRRNKDRDTSDIIKKLYARSKDLRQLKHLFESYEKLIKGIMELGTDTSSDDRDMAAMSGSTGNLLAATGHNARGVKLSQKAFDRFDRLNVRMRLLMLDTIDEYLEERTSLGDTYFNLLTQKDSQATAKLNRSASLLAKLSVFFLPISFMTSYFSVQIPDLTNGYTGTTYWVTFAVIATLSFMSLFFFSRFLMVVSDVLEEKIHAAQTAVYKSVTGKKRKGGTVEGGEEGGGTELVGLNMNTK